ncbi:MAG: NADH-quinone oxidoreductase subunit L [Alphaproteobacteria bacterium]
MNVLCITLPLFGAIIAGFFGRVIGDRLSQLVTCGAMIASAALAIPIFIDVALGGHSHTIQLFTWFQSGSFKAPWALKFDTLSAVMVLTVSVVASAIHVYSVGYMAHDKSIPRFMAYLNLFTFFMLMLVTAANFMQLFFGWEGVGLVSYLLIGFWYDRESANAAAIKAFLVNRVGDFGFALGIMGTFLLFGSVDFDTVFAGVPEKVGMTLSFLGREADAMTLVCILLFIGAMGKSAQILLHTWLPDAMEGPTPVSALIHAATMVTAGVFMVCRLSPMFEYAPDALALVTIIGATTAFFAATIGLVQNDIKRVIAYSTCSQLGYMFFAAGVSAYPAAIFHLMTHAYFKALLFLGAGSVIHAMSDEQDMRKMGGIWRKIPFTYAVMWIGSLALAGIPFFAGFYSKDIIIESAWGAGTAQGSYALWLGIAAAVMTAFYSWRLLFLTFHGAPRADAETMAHVHESPKVMTIPLAFLSLGAIGAGWLAHDLFVGEHIGDFWRSSILILPTDPALANAHHAPLWLKVVTIVAAVGGIAAAFFAYMLRPGLPGQVARALRPLYLFLYNKWYFDQLYDRLFVWPANAIGRGLWKGGDGAVIDGVGPDGLAAATITLARKAGRLQSGYVYHYAFAMLIGVVVLITWYLLSGRM